MVALLSRVGSWTGDGEATGAATVAGEEGMSAGSGGNDDRAPNSGRMKVTHDLRCLYQAIWVRSPAARPSPAAVAPASTSPPALVRGSPAHQTLRWQTSPPALPPQTPAVRHPPCQPLHRSWCRSPVPCPCAWQKTDLGSATVEAEGSTGSAGAPWGNTATVGGLRFVWELHSHRRW